MHCTADVPRVELDPCKCAPAFCPLRCRGNHYEGHCAGTALLDCKYPLPWELVYLRVQGDATEGGLLCCCIIGQFRQALRQLFLQCCTAGVQVDSLLEQFNSVLKMACLCCLFGLFCDVGCLQTARHLPMVFCDTRSRPVRQVEPQSADRSSC